MPTNLLNIDSAAIALRFSDTCAHAHDLVLSRVTTCHVSRTTDYYYYYDDDDSGR